MPLECGRDCQGEFTMPIIDEEAAQAAIHLALPTIARAMGDPAAGDSGCLHIVVMDPNAGPAASEFEHAILYEHSINRANWDADYVHFARAKALVSWRAGMDSHAVQTLRPHLLMPGDTLLWGSVCLDGLVVAVSGMQPWYDEALAGIVACCLRAVSKGRAAEAARKGLFLTRA
jgi:hypothetical protein